MRRADECMTFAVPVFVLVTGFSWRDAGKVFGVGTAHRHFTRWTEQGVRWSELPPWRHAPRTGWPARPAW